MMGNTMGADFFQNDFHCSGGEVPGEILGIRKAAMRAHKNIIVK
jgi:hypothetical protein